MQTNTTEQRLSEDYAEKTSGVEVWQAAPPYEVRLVQGHSVLLDPEIHTRLIKHRFLLHQGHYAYFRQDGIRTFVHHIVCPCPSLDQQVDHINRNTFDCRKANLRVVSRSVNTQNRKVRSDSKYKYKGVMFQKPSWRATIKKDGSTYSKASFATAEAAARWYDSMVDQLFPGGFKNFP